MNNRHTSVRAIRFMMLIALILASVPSKAFAIHNDATIAGHLQGLGSGFSPWGVSMNFRTLVAPIHGFLAVILALGACADPPTSPQNHRPVILSVRAFPEVARASDSVLVVCQAMDADNDTLVYDWITDGRMRVKGAIEGEHSLYNTHESFMVFYPVPRAIHVPVDTAWVQVFARDRRGMDAAQVVTFVIRS